MLKLSICFSKGFFGVNNINVGPGCKSPAKPKLFMPDGVNQEQIFRSFIKIHKDKFSVVQSPS